MEPMSADQNFSRPGAIDLSALAAAQPTSGAASGGAAGGSYVVEVTEATFEQLAQQSVRYPVVLLLVSGRDGASAQIRDEMTMMVDVAEGRMLLGVIDVDTEPRIAQAFGVQAVPTAIALIGGQMAPLFQGTRDSAEIAGLLDQVMQLAVANGVTGRATPQAPAANAAGAPADEEPAVDPRFAAADEALQAGDFELAVAEFDKLLKANPRDNEALAGRAQAALLVRTTEIDPDALAKADADPDDIDAQFAAADVELIGGQADAAFTRLVSLVGRTAGDDRERVRVRLVELFETLDSADPSVKKGRRALSMALF